MVNQSRGRMYRLPDNTYPTENHSVVYEHKYGVRSSWQARDVVMHFHGAYWLAVRPDGAMYRVNHGAGFESAHVNVIGANGKIRELYGDT